MNIWNTTLKMSTLGFTDFDKKLSNIYKFNCLKNQLIIGSKIRFLSGFLKLINIINTHFFFSSYIVINFLWDRHCKVL